MCGFALLELVTALVIISVGLLGVVQMYQLGVGKIRETQRRTLALHALDNEIEMLRAMPVNELVVGNDRPWRSDPVLLDSLRGARATLDIEPYSRPPLMKITARLQWHEGNHTVTREVVTLVGAQP